MFSQGENARERAKGGVGIGLALARGVLELHGGWVRAESAGVGTGSRFVIGLPRLAGRITIPRLAENRAPGSAPEQNKLRIVLADDNKDMLAGLGILLNHRGHEVFPVSSGHAAIAEAERVRPDVAVLDIGMPDLDGYEVARRIRATEWGAKLRLVALTGWGRDEDVQLSRVTSALTRT